MIKAFLFNSDDPRFSGDYGSPIRNLIFSSGILQKSQRHMKVLVGDVLAYSNSRTHAEYIDLSERIYFAYPAPMLLTKKLRATYPKATVFAWVIQNIDTKTSRQLHSFLVKDDAYLGLHSVDFSYPFHLFFYRNFMIELYRIKGRSCRVFYSMGHSEDKDPLELKSLKKIGFQDVDWEDRGLRRTIFDDYDVQEHFSRVANFKKMMAVAQLPETETEELSIMLEDLNPKLFDSLAAAARVFELAETDEELAHAGLSGRRFLEQLADEVFPARNQLFRNRKVTQKEYVNRLWAFIELAIVKYRSKVRKESLGDQVDLLNQFFNKTLHSKSDKEQLLKAYADLAKLTLNLLTLNPEGVQNPYCDVAYGEKLKSIMKKTTSSK